MLLSTREDKAHYFPNIAQNEEKEAFIVSKEMGRESGKSAFSFFKNLQLQLLSADAA